MRSARQATVAMWSGEVAGASEACGITLGVMVCAGDVEECFARTTRANSRELQCFEARPN